MLSKVFRFILRWSGLLVVPGGVLWALSPIGVSLSESLFHTSNVFWKFFPSAPLLILLGLIGLQLRQAGRSGLLEKAGFAVAALGLLVLAVGSILFAVAAPREGALPTWGLVPFVVGALCGLVSFARDLGSFGAVLWILFGLGWAWLGLSLAAQGLLPSLRTRRATRQAPATK